MLNRMRRLRSAKTKLVLKRWVLGIVIFQVVLVLIGVLAGFAVAANARLLRTDNGIYRLRVANTEAERELGLSGVAAMGDTKGMVFMFDEPNTACFWMKDMNFALDMIWLNADKQVIAVADRVAPRTYPRTYCPPTSASYVIELNAGQAKAANISVGKTLKF